MSIERHIGRDVDYAMSEGWELVSGGLKWFLDLADIEKKSDSGFRNEQSDIEAKTMEICRGGLDLMALWQIGSAQAGKERMREQPQRVTNPGLASWLADAAHETFCGKW